MAGLLEPYIPNFGDFAKSATQGYALGDTMRRRDVSVEAGGLAAKGNLRGARDALYRGGEIDDGFKVDDRMMASAKAAKTEQLEQAAKVQGMIGNLAMMADTPEKWGKAIETAKSMGLDVRKYADFSARDVALAQTGKVAEFLKMELDRRKADKETPAYEFTKYGVGNKVTGDLKPYAPGQGDPEDKFGKPPSGYRWTPAGDLEAIQGGPATDLAGDQAGRLAMMKSAQKDLPQAKKLYGEDQGISGRVAQLFNIGKTGEAERTVQQGVESAIRAMTGAAATSDETARYMKMFAPSIYDGPKTRMDKLRRLEEFMTNAEEVLLRGRGGKPAPAPTPPPGGEKTRIDLGKGTQQPGAGPGKSPKEMSDDELRKSLGL
jgi:hypothetical protein